MSIAPAATRGSSASQQPEQPAQRKGGERARERAPEGQRPRPSRWFRTSDRPTRRACACDKLAEQDVERIAGRMRPVQRHVEAVHAHREVDGVDVVEIGREEGDGAVAVRPEAGAGHEQEQVRGEKRRSNALRDAGPAPDPRHERVRRERRRRLGARLGLPAEPEPAPAGSSRADDPQRNALVEAAEAIALQIDRDEAEAGGLDRAHDRVGESRARRRGPFRHAPARSAPRRRDGARGRRGSRGRATPSRPASMTRSFSGVTS